MGSTKADTHFVALVISSQVATTGLRLKQPLNKKSFERRSLQSPNRSPAGVVVNSAGCERPR